MSLTWIRCAVQPSSASQHGALRALIFAAGAAGIYEDPAVARSLTGDGIAILSGILTDGSARMTWLLELRGWRMLHEDRADVWWSACIAR